MTERKYGYLSDMLTRAFDDSQRNRGRGMSSLVLPEGVKLFKLPKDKPFIKIDIIPFLENGTTIRAWQTYGVHRGIGPNNASVICPSRMLGKPCPICEYVAQNGRGDGGREIWRRYRAQERVLVNIVVIDENSKDEPQIQIYDASKFTFIDPILAKVDSRDVNDPVEAKWANFPDIIDGLTIKLNLELRKYEKTEYTAISSVDFKERTQKYTEDIVERAYDLSKVPHIMEYGDIQNMLDWGLGKTENTTETNSTATPAPTFDMNNGYNPLVKIREEEAAAADDVSANTMFGF